MLQIAELFPLPTTKIHTVREAFESYSEQTMKTKYHRGIVLCKNGEDNECFMKYYILRLNPMHKKRKLRYKTTSLGKHFVLVSQNLE